MAIKNKKILVFGGSQLRPNLHIEDYCEAVKLLSECVTVINPKSDF